MTALTPLKGNKMNQNKVLRIRYKIFILFFLRYPFCYIIPFIFFIGILGCQKQESTYKFENSVIVSEYDAKNNINKLFELNLNTIKLTHLTDTSLNFSSLAVSPENILLLNHFDRFSSFDHAKIYRYHLTNKKWGPHLTPKNTPSHSFHHKNSIVAITGADHGAELELESFRRNKISKTLCINSSGMMVSGSFHFIKNTSELIIGYSELNEATFLTKVVKINIEKNNISNLTIPAFPNTNYIDGVVLNESQNILYIVTTEIQKNLNSHKSDTIVGYVHSYQYPSLSFISKYQVSNSTIHRVIFDQISKKLFLKTNHGINVIDTEQKKVIQVLPYLPYDMKIKNKYLIVSTLASMWLPTNSSEFISNKTDPQRKLIIFDIMTGKIIKSINGLFGPISSS